MIQLLADLVKIPSVSGNKNIGGILGLGEYGSVANVYNLGKVSGSADVDAIMARPIQKQFLPSGMPISSPIAVTKIR